MFDMSFGEIAVIGAVALIVIGPEKLPKVARTLGAMVGKLQRYVATVKADISREMQMENLRQIEAEMKSAGQQLVADVKEGFQPIGESLADAAQTAKAGLGDPLADTAALNAHPEIPTLAEAPMTSAPWLAGSMPGAPWLESAPFPAPHPSTQIELFPDSLPLAAFPCACQLDLFPGTLPTISPERDRR